jgi:GR25 family glycosyltransferase involved in LPS biosynthesis
MIKNNYEYVVIFQDDVIFKDNFINDLDKVMDNLPKNAEIINIGFHKYAAFDKFIPWNFLTDDSNIQIKNKVNDFVCKLVDTINPCSLGYIVTLQGAKNLVANFKTNGFIRATDRNFNDYLISKDIFYGTNTVLCTGNNKLGSDIFC